MKKINTKLLNLPFDLFGRYKIISEIINSSRKHKKHTILDVGGLLDGSVQNPLQSFLPKDKVTILDKLKSNNYQTIKGDFLKNNFSNLKFDFIVSTDVVEHIPNNKKLSFLEKQIALSRISAIIAAPFFSRDVIKSEKIVSDLYFNIYKSNHKWLKEHNIFRHPSAKTFEKYLRKVNYPYYKIENNYLPHWTIMNIVNILPRLNRKLTQKQDKINRYFNLHIQPYDHKKPNYRTFYVISKKSNFYSRKFTQFPAKDFSNYLQSEAVKLLGSNLSLLINSFQELDSIKNSRSWRYISGLKKVTDKIT